MLENQSADHCFALMRKWDLLNTLNLDETDDSLPPSLHEGSDSRSEVEASDCESEGGLWIGGPSPVVAGRSTPSGAAPALKRSTDSPRPAESPRPTGSRRASIASLGSGSLRGGRKGSGRSARDRQAELAQMVEDLMLSAILYTDMKSHFQLQDRLEKIIEQAEQDDPAEDEEEDRSPFVAAAIRRRASVPPPMPSAPSQNSQTSFGSSGGAVRDEDADEDDDEDEDEDSEALDAVETTASEEPFSISNAADDILSQHSSQSWIRRKSVMVVHADDPNPSLDGNPEDRNSGMSYGHRRRSILVQHADDSDPHGDDEEESVGTPLETVASVPSIAPSDRRKSISAVSEHSTSSSGPQGTTNWEDTPNANITHEPLDVPPQPQGGPRRPSVQFSDVDEIVRLRAAVPQPTSAGRRRKSMEFEQRRLLLTAILHAADISNPARPWVARTCFTCVACDLCLIISPHFLRQMAAVQKMVRFRGPRIL